MRVRERRVHRPGTRDLICAGYVATMIAAAAVAAWPIYRSAAFVLLVVTAAVVGGVLAGIARRLRWRAWVTALAVGVAILVLGVPLAVPSRLTGLPEVALGLLDVLSGAVLGWKDLVTVELPVGSYRNLLVPALIVFLAGTTSALLLSWRRGPRGGLAVLVTLGMLAFGLLFGRPVTSAPLTVGSLTIPAPFELLTGAVGLIASVLWLTWCTYDDRARALRRAAAASGVRMSRRRSASDRRRMALGAVMVVAPVAVAVVVAPTLAQGLDREVLRSASAPDLALSRAVSPLAEYRTHFDDDRYAQVLFRVDPVADEELPERLRLATLAHYDGEVFRAVDPQAAVGDQRYLRVPSTLTAPPGSPVAARIEIDTLEGIWLPTAGVVQQVRFDGERASDLADGFYYNQALASGIEVAGLDAGDSYVLRATEPETPALAEIDAPGGQVRAQGTPEAPEALRTWVTEHVEGTGGAALAHLVDLLRERGYLSHALTAPTSESSWMDDLEGYVFESSASGHSLARVGLLFEQLLEREEATAAGESLVAAIGDDEQFSVAVALVARELGFPARIVVGVRLGGDEPLVDGGGAGLPACANGQCRAADIAAWTEVQSADGQWVPIDATPQHTVGVDAETTTQRDPRNETEVRPDVAEAVAPPDPVQQDGADEPPTPPATGPDLSVLWTTLRITGVAVLVLAALAGPFLAVVVAKSMRRRARRARPEPAAAIAGGWDEYLDAAVDSGRVPPQAQTRSELADIYATPRAAVLARVADAAVFSDAPATADDADEFWRIVDGERRALHAESGMFARVRAAVSWRSFTRSLTGAPRRRSGSTAERRTRRPDGRAH